MAIEINSETIGMWCVELKGPRGNWLAHLGKAKDRVVLDYRFRWYEDDKIGAESADQRNFYRLEAQSGEEAKLLALTRQIAEQMNQHAGIGFWELLRGERTLDEYTAALAEMPGMHTRVETLQ